MNAAECVLFQNVNDLVIKATAFTGLDEMRLAMQDGYIPTLCRGKALQQKLGQYLERMGWKVFWTGKA